MRKIILTVSVILIFTGIMVPVLVLSGCGGSDSNGEEKDYAILYHAVGGPGMVTVFLPGGGSRTDHFYPWYSFGITADQLASDPNFTPLMTCDNPKTLLFIYQDGNICNGLASLCVECK